MYSRGQKQDESKYSALLARLHEVRQHATQLRAGAALQRQRLLSERTRPPESIHRPAPVRDTAGPPAERQLAPAVVAFAGSAGSLTPLLVVLDALPAALPAAVLVAMHTAGGSSLPSLLQLRCRLPVKFAEGGETLRAGIVYVARPQLHLLVNANRTLTLADKERLRFARPSADWLFETLAASYGDSAIGVVLSGYKADGARGLVRILDAGGSTIAQDPDSAIVPDMPVAAIRMGSVSAVLRPELISAAIVDRIGTFDVERMRQNFDNPFAATA